MATTEQEVIDALQRIARATNSDRVSHQTYVRHVRSSEPAAITAIRLFGSWRKATEAAGLRANPFTKDGERSVGDAEAFDAVRRAAIEYSSATGNPPARLTQAYYMGWRERQISPARSVLTLTKRYGPWKDLKHRVGLAAPTPGLHVNDLSAQVAPPTGS